MHLLRLERDFPKTWGHDLYNNSGCCRHQARYENDHNRGESYIVGIVKRKQYKLLVSILSKEISEKYIWVQKELREV